MAGVTVTLKVPYVSWGKTQEETFKISFVSNWATNEFKEITEDSIEIHKEYLALKSNEKTFDGSSSDIFNRGQNLLERKYELLKDILESNGHEFNAKFWDRKTDPDTVNKFIMQAIHKDLQGSKKKV